jgi:hypothetical protein
MILRIQTLYLFLVFALGFMLFMQNPIVNEIMYRDGKVIYIEFSQFWSEAKVFKDSAQPVWSTNYGHLGMLIVLSVSCLVAIFFPRSPRLQFLLCTISMLLTVWLSISLLLHFRIRLTEIGQGLIDSVETPHMLWFGLLLAFQISVLRFLWAETKKNRLSELVD